MNEQAYLPYIPEFITVHLGAPDSNAQNVTVSFPDYIKNVASSEIYPTWPESAIRANIYAQISFALNKIYTEFYRSQSYDFDITNVTAYDQSFVYGREVFENISQIVDEIFNSYISRRDTVIPLYAVYCDGINTTCDGLSQWGSVELANKGFGAYDILTNYYGDDIDLVTNVPVNSPQASLPPVLLSLGSVGNEVRTLQIRLNRISQNFPAIPKIYPIDGVFGEETERAVKKFQEIFNLTQDGIVGNATWYRIQYYYNGVKRLNELYSESLGYDEISKQFTDKVELGSTGADVLTIQYFLSLISEFVGSVTPPLIDGYFGPETQNSVTSFQQTYGLPVTGAVDLVTWDALHDRYADFIRTIISSTTEGQAIPFPGTVLSEGAENENVRLLQGYLNVITTAYPFLPSVNPNGVFDANTAEAVRAFQEYFGLDVSGIVAASTWNKIADVYNDIVAGLERSVGQYPGYNIE